MHFGTILVLPRLTAGLSKTLVLMHPRQEAEGYDVGLRL
jgi:hypothetical protein